MFTQPSQAELERQARVRQDEQAKDEAMQSDHPWKLWAIKAAGVVVGMSAAAAVEKVLGGSIVTASLHDIGIVGISATVVCGIFYLIIQMKRDTVLLQG